MTGEARVRFFAVAGVVCAAVAACRQLVGIGDSPPGGVDAATDGGVDGPEAGSGNACGLSYGSTCASCVATSCCAAATECSMDPVCDAYATCLAGCDGGEACGSQCLIDHPIGESTTVAALVTCLATSCEAPCDLPCGNLSSDFAPPDAASSCAKCLAADECPTAQACIRSTDCFGLAECLLACGPGFDCSEQCSATHEAGAAVFSAFALQFSGTCAAPCAYGNWWSCAGHVTRPTALVDSTTITFGAESYDTPTPIAGLQAVACRASDFGCTSPLADGGTDDAGRVSLTVPQVKGSTGFDGYYGFSSLDGGVVPTLVYLSFPVREASLFVGVQFATPSLVQQILAGLQVPPGSGGYLVLDAYDCFNVQARGVTFSTSAPADAGVQIFYEEGSLFSASATMTDPSGAAILVNVPAGTIDVFATPSGSSSPSSHLTVNVEDGKITVVLLFPD